MMQVIIQYVVSIFIVGGTYALLPVITPDTVQFGVRIPPAHVKSRSIAKVRKTYYSVWALILAVTLVVSVLSEGLLTPSETSQTLFAPLIVLGVVLVCNYANYYCARRRLLAAKESEHWYDGVSEGLVADTSMHNRGSYPSIAWAIPAVIVTLVSVILPAVRYSKLPERMAVHFTAAGVADGFAVKSFWIVFGPAMTQIILLVVMFVVHFSLHRFAVRLDPSNPDGSRHRYTVLRREGMKAVWVMLAVMNVGMTFTLLPLWGVLPQSVGTISGIGTGVIVFGVLVSILWISRAAQRTRQIASTVASPVVARDDDRFWIGGAFYFNREDSALFVPKRFGIGITVNFGNPIAWIVLIVLIAIPVVISLLGARR